MLWLIAYDVAHPRRLRRTARVLERRAQRVQKSVFIFQGDDESLRRLLDRAADCIDPRADRLQAWPLASRRAAYDRGPEASLLPLARSLVAAPGLLVYVRPALGGGSSITRQAIPAPSKGHPSPTQSNSRRSPTTARRQESARPAENTEPPQTTQ